MGKHGGAGGALGIVDWAGREMTVWRASDLDGSAQCR
jgi:hypothetical protein